MLPSCSEPPDGPRVLCAGSPCSQPGPGARAQGRQDGKAPEERHGQAHEEEGRHGQAAVKRGSEPYTTLRSVVVTLVLYLCTDIYVQYVYISGGFIDVVGGRRRKEEKLLSREVSAVFFRRRFYYLSNNGRGSPQKTVLYTYMM